MTKFKYFLLNEDRSYLGHKVGDVLTSAQELEQDMENLGSRQITKYAEEIVNQIRKILHSRWNPKHNHQLKDLQKIAVAIQKTIDDKGDLKQILPAASQALQDLSGKLGVKVNSLEAPEAEDAGGEPIDPNQLQSTGPMPPFKKQQQQPQGQFPPDMPQAQQGADMQG